MDYFLKRPNQITFAVNVSISCVMTGSTGIAHCTGWSLGAVVQWVVLGVSGT